MAQSKDIIPGHKVVKQTIASDRVSATGAGKIGGSIKQTSAALNVSQGKGPGAGSMGVGRPRPMDGCKE